MGNKAIILNGVCEIIIINININFFMKFNICIFQAKYISQCMEDIKQELRQDNLAVKSNAIAKLTYVRTVFF